MPTDILVDQHMHNDSLGEADSPLFVIGTSTGWCITCALYGMCVVLYMYIMYLYEYELSEK